jgi:hypothetical protein
VATCIGASTVSAGAIEVTVVRIWDVQAASGSTGKHGRRVAIGESSRPEHRNESLARGSIPEHRRHDRLNEL